MLSMTKQRKRENGETMSVVALRQFIERQLIERQFIER